MYFNIIINVAFVKNTHAKKIISRSSRLGYEVSLGVEGSLHLLNALALSSRRVQIPPTWLTDRLDKPPGQEACVCWANQAPDEPAKRGYNSKKTHVQPDAYIVFTKHFVSDISWQTDTCCMEIALSMR
ncbi:unnamed protein product [Protopolystoma xenopodis]|uniref:Uncharacterized protein n=1 Tax=Protopolystoma xenopodis TaxID=117903 RepID=A0A3S5CTU5_9PLAT|nr:unnamed protein product [Protopolystoma xenopodis]